MLLEVLAKDGSRLGYRLTVNKMISWLNKILRNQCNIFSLFFEMLFFLCCLWFVFRGFFGVFFFFPNSGIYRRHTLKKKTSLYVVAEVTCAILAQIKSDYMYLFLSTFERSHEILWEDLKNNFLVSTSRYLVLMHFLPAFKSL